MASARKGLTVTLERTITAAPNAVFDAWLDPAIPGNPWHEADKFVLNAKPDGLFFSRMRKTPHYGRFTKVDRPRSLQHTWMSPYTEGLESIVTVTFRPKGNDTVMRLVHSGLPDTEKGKAHEEGWTYFMENFPQWFLARHQTKQKAKSAK